MSPTNVVPVVVAAVIATFCSFLLSRKDPVAAGGDRFLGVDGLRGYLALSVFLHHSCVWYFYLRTGRWELPPSRLYVQLGQSSVALFFMITGFLFYSKLLNAGQRPFDWQRLYISRVLRLTPLYLFAIALMLLIVLASSAGELHNTPARVAFQVFRWLTFTVLGGPDINGLNIAQVIVAKVVWTLPYEWVFYLALPLLALTVGIRPSWRYLFLVLLAVAIACIRHFEPIILLVFAGGILAAILVKYPAFCAFAASRIGAVLAIASLAIAVSAFSSGYGLAQLVLLTVFFCIIAAGNDLFGLLTRPAARKLGEIAYSVYMLHGLMLYTTFILILGASRSRQLSPMLHWAVVIGITPVLLLVCHATFRFIEYPAMRSLQNIPRRRQPSQCETSLSTR